MSATFQSTESTSINYRQGYIPIFTIFTIFLISFKRDISKKDRRLGFRGLSTSKSVVYL